MEFTGMHGNLLESLRIQFLRFQLAPPMKPWLELDFLRGLDAQGAQQTRACDGPRLLKLPRNKSNRILRKVKHLGGAGVRERGGRCGPGIGHLS